MSKPKITPPPARVRVRTRPNPTPTAVAPPQDYEVGYCRPPVSGQFQPGKSGNPKGRKKGSRNAATILRAELAKPIQAKVGGKTVRMTRLEAIVQRFIERCLNGEMRAITLLLKMSHESDPAEAATAQGLQEPITAAEQLIMDAMMANLRQEAGQ